MSYRSRKRQVEIHGSVLERFFKENFAAVRRSVQKMLPAGEDASDIVQEAMLRAHATGNIDTMEHPAAYICTTARHIALDHLRKMKLVRHHADQSNGGSIEYFWGNTPEGHTHYNRSLQALADAVTRLPEKTRKAFVLRMFHNLSYGEIAIEMGISIKTVEKHISKGLIHCRIALDKHGFIASDQQ